MKKKWPLFTGILILTIGIVLRKATHLNMIGLLMILTGAAFKTYYIVIKIKNGEYKPGYELILLCLGLMLFLTGIYLRSTGIGLYPTLLIPSGIALKLIFIILFIRKSRNTTPKTKS